MDTPRLMRPGSVLRLSLESVAILFRNFPVLFVSFLLSFVPAMLLVVIGTVLIVINASLVGIILLVLGYVGLLAGVLYYSVVVTIVVALDVAGHKAGFMQITRRIHVGVVWAVVITGLLVGITISIPPGIVFIIGLMTNNQVIFVLCSVVALILLLALAVRFMFTSPIVIMEHIRYVAALKRSQALSAGLRWRILGNYLFLEFMAFFAGGLAYFIVYLLLLVLHGPVSMALPISYIFAYIFGVSVGLIFPTRLYYDIRIRKEALEIETLREVAAVA